MIVQWVAAGIALCAAVAAGATLRMHLDTRARAQAGDVSIDLADIRWWNDSDRRIGQVTIHAWDKVTQQTLIPAVGTQYMEAHTEGGYIGATWPGRTDAAVYMEFRDADGRCWQGPQQQQTQAPTRQHDH